MALAEELAAGKGVYTTHLRSEFEPILGRWTKPSVLVATATPVVVSHHKCAGAKTGAYQRDAGLFR